MSKNIFHFLITLIYFRAKLITIITVLGYSSSRLSSSSDRTTVASGAIWLSFSAISSSFLVSARPQRPNRQYTTHTHTHKSRFRSRTPIYTRYDFDRGLSCVRFRSDVVIPHFHYSCSLLSRNIILQWFVPNLFRVSFVQRNSLGQENMAKCHVIIGDLSRRRK